MDVYESKSGYIWVGTWGAGLSRFRADEVDFIANGILPEIQRYTYDINKTDCISGNIVQEITEDSYGNLWVGTENGLNIFNVIENKFYQIKHANDDSKSLSNNSIQSECIIEDGHLNLWFGTWNGLCRIRLENLPYRNGIRVSDNDETIHFDHFLKMENDTFSLGDNRITSLLEDNNGNIWVGTFGGGLNYIDLSGPNVIVTKYTKNNGLPDEVVYGIEKGSNDNIWISTNNGLSQFNPSSEVFNNFNAGDNLQGDEFYWGAHLRKSDGQLIFGGTNGYSMFYPDSIKPNQLKSKTIITGINIFNTPIDFKLPNSLLKKSIEFTNRILLSHKQNMITFDYTSLNFNHPEQAHFAYILEGFEQDWNFVESRRTAIYTNLEPGNYKFKVAEVIGGIELDLEGMASIDIEIKTPFYKSSVFKVLIATFFILLLLLFYRIKVRNIERHKRVLQQKVNERTTELTLANELLIKRNKEIDAQQKNLIAQHEKIRIQNGELEVHRSGLEEKVKERTNELLNAKEKAEESDRLKSAFLANMSHEIRTPLNAVVGFSNLLNDNDLDDHHRKMFIHQISQNTDDLLMLVDDIIDLSFIEAGQLKIQLEEFDLVSFMKDIFQLYKQKTIDKQLDFRLQIEESVNIIRIKSDAQRLRQIILNLINNAIKFTDEGYIEFGFVMNNDSATFYVKDTGIGISEENQILIFDRFRKIEDNNLKLYRGSGLGLTISKKLASLLYADLTVESEVGKGSTFSLSLMTNFILVD